MQSNLPLNLVIQTAFLGDLLLSIPLLKSLRQQWPNHKLGLVCRKGFGDFFLRTGLVDHCFEIQKGQKDTYSRVKQELKSYEIDHLISPHESLRTVFFSLNLKAKNKISYKNAWNFFAFDERVERDKRLPDAIRQLSLLAPVNAELKQKISHYLETAQPFESDMNSRLSVPPEWVSMSLRKQLLADTSTYETLAGQYDLKAFATNKAVLIFPGSVWATKRWTEAGFVGVGQQLTAEGYQVYVMGGPGEEALAQSVQEQIPGSINLAGKTKVYESAQMIARAAILIGNDSASTHLAAVCETPLIAIFGPTILSFGFRPWGKESYVVEKKGLRCRPCGKHGHHVCPIGTHECMKDISAKDVLHIAKAILR